MILRESWLKPTIPKSYRVLLDKIVEDREKHTARIVIRDHGIRKSRL